MSSTSNFATRLTWSRMVIVILAAWIVFSVPFVGYQAWRYLEDNHYRTGVQDGARQVTQAIYDDLIQKASNPACNTVYVQQDEARVDLINVRCLRVVRRNPDAATAPAQKVSAPATGQAVSVPAQAGRATVGGPADVAKADAAVPTKSE